MTRSGWMPCGLIGWHDLQPKTNTSHGAIDQSLR